MAVRDELQARAHFQERYGNTPSPTASRVEQRVIGGDWGANGYTTMAQADTLARELGLSPGELLLDLGTGRGRRQRPARAQPHPRCWAMIPRNASSAPATKMTVAR
jgi:hypothetical protein